MKGRYVYLTSTTNEYLNLRELEVYGLGGETPSVALGPNLARQCGAFNNAACDVQVAYQHATTATWGVAHVNDGDLTSKWHSDSKNDDQWLYVDLEESKFIEYIRFQMRDQYQERLDGLQFWISTQAYSTYSNIVANAEHIKTISQVNSDSECWDNCLIPCNTHGQYVYLTLNTEEYFFFNELEVYGTVASAVTDVCAASEHDYSADDTPELVCPANEYKTGGCEIVDPPWRDRTYSSYHS